MEKAKAIGKWMLGKGSVCRATLCPAAYFKQLNKPQEKFLKISKLVDSKVKLGVYVPKKFQDLKPITKFYKIHSTFGKIIKHVF